MAQNNNTCMRVLHIYVLAAVLYFVTCRNSDFDLRGRNYEPRFFPKNVRDIRIGAVLPKTSLLTFQRRYFKTMQTAITNINTNKYTLFNFTERYKIAQGPWLMMTLAASPLEILKTLCDHLLMSDVITIIYFTNAEAYGSNAASVQYLLQLTGYLGLPVIAWNVDNVGLYQV